MGLQILNSSYVFRDGGFISSEPVPYGSIYYVISLGGTNDTLEYRKIDGTPTSIELIAGQSKYIVTQYKYFKDSNAYGNTKQVQAMDMFLTSSIDETPVFTEITLFPSSSGDNTITTAGSWTKPLGVTQVVVECWGAGGAGGGSSKGGLTGCAGGGAGAQYARSAIIYPTAQQTINFVIAGDTIATDSDGRTGDDTTWNSTTVIAKGGQGGTRARGSGAYYANGGFGSILGGVGQVVYKGGNGVAGIEAPIFGRPIAGGGGGGAASVGNGNDASGLSGGALKYWYGGEGGFGDAATDGSSGTAFGAGGSGNGSFVSPNLGIGGNGVGGGIRLMYR
jgi:hypothetical protein